MGIVITGASGFVGLNIIPILKCLDNDLLLVGRNEERLQKLFPNMKVSDYENLEVAAKGYNTLVHLAVLNSDRAGDIKDFRSANVTHLKKIIQVAKTLRIKTFIYTSTLHAADKKNMSPYATSKREAEEILSEINGIAIVKLRLPAVYAKTYAGKLKKLELLPSFLRPTMFKILAALKPTVHVRHVASAIEKYKNTRENIEIIVSDRQKGNWFYDIVKRIMDLGFAIFVIIFLCWLLIIAWIAVKFTSSGPAIFAQERVGKEGKLFTCYKFRTMYVGTKQAGTHEVGANNITKVGTFLRKTKIDELPQVVNILKNDLSLVGARPCLPVQKQLIAERKKRGVFEVKGGITGWAQVQGVDMSDPEYLAKLDAQYIDLRSILLDIKIVFRTIFKRNIITK